MTTETLEETKGNDKGGWGVWLRRLAELAVFVTVAPFCMYLLGWLALSSRMATTFSFLSLDELLYATGRVANFTVVTFGLRVSVRALAIIFVSSAAFFWLRFFLTRHLFRNSEEVVRFYARQLRISFPMVATLTGLSVWNQFPSNTVNLLRLSSPILILLLFMIYSIWIGDSEQRKAMRQAFNLYIPRRAPRHTFLYFVLLVFILVVSFPPANPLPCLQRKITGQSRIDVFDPNEGKSYMPIGFLLGQSDGHWFIIDRFGDIEARSASNSPVKIIADASACARFWEP